MVVASTRPPAGGAVLGEQAGGERLHPIEQRLGGVGGRRLHRRLRPALGQRWRAWRASAIDGSVSPTVLKRPKTQPLAGEGPAAQAGPAHASARTGAAGAGQQRAIEVEEGGRGSPRRHGHRRAR